jgi:hypothetical protein
MTDFDIEQPAGFYLGREYDLASRCAPPDRPPVMLDARDLTTHGVVVGMTGSGKTGLSLTLLEEAAIDGIPTILIDPKGDLGNLLLQFPALRPDDFKPWIDPEEARTRKLSPDDYARQVADRWRQGLADTLQSPERIARLRDSGEWAVYTPGSEAGLPLSVLKTFAAPDKSLPREALNQRIDATASALLGLGGLEADPVQSREHILVAQLLLHAWTKGESLDLTQLIQRVQAPPIAQVGAFDVETFYPEKERLKLAVALNRILAAPSFSTWITGDPLDLTKLLAPAAGKPRHLIFYLAHLEDAQRMFFLTLLLEEILSWTRRQPGTSGLRALVYFDEVFGYLPPHPANPPSKQPLLTLLKQARAFGVGILLATQNPVDLDYKALSNAGTWFVGKLQTERDKARLVEGLEGVAAERGTLADRAYLETVISALGQRVFLLHDVHRPKPVLFQTRQALSFLRGPMTLEQVGQLMAGRKQAAPATAPPPAAPGAAAPPAARAPEQAFKEALRRSAPPGPEALTDAPPPSLPAWVSGVYLPVHAPAARAVAQPLPTPPRGPAPAARPVASLRLVYRPRLLTEADVLFVDRKRALEVRRNYRLLTELPATGQPLDWSAAEPAPEGLTESPEPGARWAALPDPAEAAKRLRGWQKEFDEFLYRSAKLSLFENRDLKLISAPGEDAASFHERCRAAAHAAAETELAKARTEFKPRFDRLGVPMPEEPEAGRHGSALSGLLSLFRTGPTVVTLGPATKKGKPTAADAARTLQEEWQAKRAEIVDRWRRVGEAYEELRLTPRRVDVQVTRLTLAWAPFWQVTAADGGVEVRPAYPRQR